VRQTLAQLARKGHSVVAEYVPGVRNRADNRHGHPQHGTTGTSGGICPGGSVAPDRPLRPTIDAFADDHKHHLPHYWSYLPSPHASGTEAMAQVWHRRQKLYINPPWGMIARILAKLKDDKARAVIVAPRWQSAWWWPTQESMRLGPP